MSIINFPSGLNVQCSRSIGFLIFLWDAVIHTVIDTCMPAYASLCRTLISRTQALHLSVVCFIALDVSIILSTHIFQIKARVVSLSYIKISL